MTDVTPNTCAEAIAPPALERSHRPRRVARGRKGLLYAAKLSVGLAIVAVLFWLVDGREALGYLAEANGWLLLLGAVLNIGQTALGALKWRVILSGRGFRVPYLLLLRSCFIGKVANLFAPTFIAGDTYRAASVRGHVGSFARSLPFIVADRATGLVALATLGSVGLGITFAGDRYPLAVSAVLLAIVVGYAMLVTVAVPALARFAEARNDPLTRFACDVGEAFRPTPALGKAQLLAFVFQANVIVICIIYAAGLQLSATVPQLILIVPCVYLLEMLPLSAGGIGVRETAFSALFMSFGLPPEQGLALGLLVSAMRYLLGGLGAFAFLIPVDPAPDADGA